MKDKIESILLQMGIFEEEHWKNILNLMLFMGIFAFILTPFWDPDVYWQLALGRQMWQWDQIHWTDTLSWTEYGMPWLNSEWMAEVILWPLYYIGGFNLLILFKASMGILSIFFFKKTFDLLKIPFWLFLLSLISIVPLVSYRTRERPEMFTFLFFTMLWYVLNLFIEKKVSNKFLFWFLWIEFTIWANCHGGFSYGWALLFCTMAGWGIDEILNKTFDKRKLSIIVTCGVIAFASTFFNPYIQGIPMFPLVHFKAMYKPYVKIQEWVRTPKDLFQGYSFFWVPIIIFMLIIILHKKKNYFAHLLPSLCGAFLGYYWVRYPPFSMFIILTYIAYVISEEIHKRYENFFCKIRKGIIYVSLFTVFVFSVRICGKAELRKEIKSNFLVNELNFLMNSGLHGNMYHNFAEGGYISFYANEKYPSFWNGRYFAYLELVNDILGDRSLPRGVLSIKRLHAHYRFDIVLYTYPAIWLKPNAKNLNPRSPIIEWFPQKDWAIVYFDDMGMVLLKRIPAYKTFIEANEFKILNPDDRPYLLGEIKERRIDYNLFLKEMMRKKMENPYSKVIIPFQDALYDAYPELKLK